jgi:hypothetical protein
MTKTASSKPSAPRVSRAPRTPNNQGLRRAEQAIGATDCASIREIVNTWSETGCIVLAAYASRKARGVRQVVPLNAVVSCGGAEGEKVQGVVVKKLGAEMLKCVTAEGKVFTAPASECKIVHLPA